MTPFDVVLVPFPFADLRATKRRPCLVLATYRPRSLGEHCVLAMMTSQVNHPRFKFDILVENLKEAGLPKPTLVRLGKIVTLQTSLIHKKLGSLAESDRSGVAEQFKLLFGPVLLV